VKVFYFKNQDIEDFIRTDNGIVELNDNGKGTKEDYYSIQLKVPKRNCVYDFRNIQKWTRMELLTAFDYEALQMEGGDKLDRVEVLKAMKSYFEEEAMQLEEKIRSELAVKTPTNGSKFGFK